jgi:ELWxxDGT repeat protein
VTDGTEQGTQLVKDIAPGVLSSYFFPFIPVGDQVMFLALDAAHGLELWRSDGTEEGTHLYQDIHSGQRSAFATFQPLTLSGDRLWLVASDGVSGFEPWSLPTTAITGTAILPSSGSHSGQSATVTGLGLVPGATFALDGDPASNIEFGTPAYITGVTPPLAPGTLNDLTLTSPGDPDVVVPDAFFADFLDVSQTHPFHDFVEALVRGGVTAGCTGGNYCPDSSVTREQMAVFLLRSNDGPTYTPPVCTVPAFADVSCSSPYAIWVNELVARSVTAGCGGGNYCPGDAVTREQMAVFLLRTFEGPTYTPPDCTVPTYSDVPCSSPFARWIEELVLRGITAGCGGGLYCPLLAVSRGQMAVLLTATFGL